MNTIEQLILALRVEFGDQICVEGVKTRAGTTFPPSLITMSMVEGNNRGKPWQLTIQKPSNYVVQVESFDLHEFDITACFLLQPGTVSETRRVSKSAKDSHIALQNRVIELLKTETVVTDTRKKA